MRQLSVFAIALLALASEQALGAGDAEHGKALYQARCTACHSIEFNGAGPAHKGVFGRKAGSAPGFAYSKALKDTSVVWGEETLARWLENPEAFIPGQRMFVQTPDGATITKVTLIHTGSVTHAFDEAQRLVSLSFVQVSGGLSVTLPASRNLAPPGPYMLFLVNGNGVPSVAPIMILQ